MKHQTTEVADPRLMTVVPDLLLTRDQARAADAIAIGEWGIPGVVLMENAGRNIAATAMGMLQELGVPPGIARAAVVCGGGNNGGDGLVAARHLHNAGVHVTIHLATHEDRMVGEAGVNLGIVGALGIGWRLVLDAASLEEQGREWDQCHLLIDALLGTGFEGQVRSPMAGVIQRVNLARSRGAKVLSVDVPSGLDAQTGEAGGEAVRADVTVTLLAVKCGLAASHAGEYVGRLVLADIGTPPALVERVAGR